MSDTVPGSSLPIPDQAYVGPLTVDARKLDEKQPALIVERPPAQAPNVLLILLDDVGFGASSTFGGPIHTPVSDRLADGGLRYNRFHTTAICSPTRAAMLSGRNHHQVGMGQITETATPSPGYRSTRPNSCVPLPEILRQAGYNTAQFGKCHEVPVWESGPTGPFDHWPAFSGFEKFYGFIGGETNQGRPTLHIMYRRTGLPSTRVSSIRVGMRYERRHSPARRRSGILPPDAELTARSEGIPAWDDVDDAMKPILAHQMEVYAAFMEYADHHIGRVVDAVENLGLLDDTLVYYIIGDNGASAEGGLNGTYMITTVSNGGSELETQEFWDDHVDKLGSPEAYNHYAVGWAHAMCTPYQWTKQVASHYGGTRTGAVVHWPGRIQGAGEVRPQWHHVIDIAPTILELVGLAEPHTVNGVTQVPMHGVSMAYSFNDAGADERHHTQYFEIMGNRGIYHKGWTAETKHRTPWDLVGSAPDFNDDIWELYDTTTDWTQSNDLSKEDPAKLTELQQLFLIEATRYNVLPLDDRAAQRMNPEFAGRPTLVAGDRLRLYPGMIRLNENVAINVKNRSLILGDRPNRRARRWRRGRDPGPGRAHRRLGVLGDRRQAGLSLQFLRAAAHDRPCRFTARRR